MLRCFNNSQMKPFCKRCLLSEYDEKFYAETVSDYIAHIPEDKKCGSEEYSRRLDICRSCDELSNGMCGECGCFVEVRAAKSHMGCPVSKW